MIEKFQLTHGSRKRKHFLPENFQTLVSKKKHQITPQ